MASLLVKYFALLLQAEWYTYLPQGAGRRRYETIITVRRATDPGHRLGGGGAARRRGGSAAGCSRISKEDLKPLLGKADVAIIDVRSDHDWKDADMMIQGASGKTP